MSTVKIAAKQKQVESRIPEETFGYIEARKQRPKQQQEQLQLEEDIAVNEAQANTLERLETISNKSRSVHSINCDYRSKEDHSVLSSSNNDVLMTVVHHLSKPPSDMITFNGNPLNYRRFMK